MREIESGFFLVLSSNKTKKKSEMLLHEAMSLPKFAFLIREQQISRRASVF